MGTGHTSPLPHGVPFSDTEVCFCRCLLRNCLLPEQICHQDLVQGLVACTQEVTMGREDPNPGLLSPSALTCSLGGCGAGLPSVPESSGGAGPGGSHILRRAARWPWCPGWAAQNPLFLGCSQAPVGPQGIRTRKRPPPRAKATGPLAVGGQAQVAVHILRNDGDALAQGRFLYIVPAFHFLLLLSF